MVLLIVGGFFLALGLFSGAALVAVSLGVSSLTAGPALWVLFPLFSVLGYILFVMGARTNQMRVPTLVAAGSMLLLALVSALGIVLQAAAVIRPETSTVALWYVLVVGGIIGSVGVASYSKPEVVAS